MPDFKSDLNHPDPHEALALDLLNLVLSRGLSLEDSALALGTAAKAVAIQHQAVLGNELALARARALLTEGYDAQLIIASSGPSQLRILDDATQAEKLLANAEARTVKP